ncbi:MAG: HPF/RaiA family ribosome-associated protein [Acidobacteria bacterium]|nr:HPF/RaiA family ribosome-associated protein [Acidobacteriota bacterium]
MKVTYTGKSAEFNPHQQSKLEQKFLKLGKLIDRPSEEKEARVILTTERHLTHAEITVYYFDHQIVGVGSDSDVPAAVTDALDKLEKQILKQQTKWRDTNRVGAKEQRPERLSGPAEDIDEDLAGSVEVDGGAPRRVFRVDHFERRKPMTIDEALLEIDDHAYVVYRDAETDRVCVLVRRQDGHFDLIEA